MVVFGQSYVDTPYGSLIESKGICSYKGKMVLTWSFEDDGSGDYSISHESTTKCEKSCNPTPMQGGSLWGMKVTQTDSGMTGSMTLNLKLCCGPCSDLTDTFGGPQGQQTTGTATIGRGEGAKFTCGDEGPIRCNSGPDFIRNVRNAVFGGDGKISRSAQVVIRRQMLAHSLNTSPKDCGGVSCS